MIKELLLYFALLLWFVVPLQAQPTIFASDIRIVNDNAQFDVKAKNFDTLQSLQFAIDWDQDLFEFVTLNNFSLTNAGTNNYNISSTGKLRINWFGDALQIEDNQILFTVNFKITGTVNDDTSIEFTDDITGQGTNFIVEFLDGNSNLLDVQFGLMTSTNVVPANIKLHQNKPNPFHTETIILFELKTAETITFSVIDILGHELLRRTAKYSTGKHHLTITNEDLPSSGTYFYQIRGAHSVDFCKKLIFSK